MYKIAVIGDKATVAGFSAVGIDCFVADDADSASFLLKKLASEQYGVIFITEKLGNMLDGEIEKYSQQLVPSVVLIPGTRGNTGEGMEKVLRRIRQAVGSDLVS